MERKKIVTNQIDEFFGPFYAPHHDERSNKFVIDQKRIVLRYSMLQIRSFVKQMAKLEDSIQRRKIEDPTSNLIVTKKKIHMKDINCTVKHCQQLNTKNQSPIIVTTGGKNVYSKSL